MSYNIILTLIYWLSKYSFSNCWTSIHSTTAFFCLIGFLKRSQIWLCDIFHHLFFNKMVWQWQWQWQKHINGFYCWVFLLLDHHCRWLFILKSIFLWILFLSLVSISFFVCVFLKRKTRTFDIMLHCCFGCKNGLHFILFGVFLIRFAKIIKNWRCVLSHFLIFSTAFVIFVIVIVVVARRKKKHIKKKMRK